MPLGLPGNAGSRPPSGRVIALVFFAILLFGHPVVADPWYEHYANAEQALADEDWALAVEKINEALAKKKNRVTGTRGEM